MDAPGDASISSNGSASTYRAPALGRTRAQRRVRGHELPDLSRDPVLRGDHVPRPDPPHAIRAQRQLPPSSAKAGTSFSPGLPGPGRRTLPSPTAPSRTASRPVLPRPVCSSANPPTQPASVPSTRPSNPISMLARSSSPPTSLWRPSAKSFKMVTSLRGSATASSNAALTSRCADALIALAISRNSPHPPTRKGGISSVTYAPRSRQSLEINRDNLEVAPRPQSLETRCTRQLWSARLRSSLQLPETL